MQQKLPKNVIANCLQFCGCFGTLVEEYLVISSVYALIDYIILIFCFWLEAAHTLGHKGSCFRADNTLEHTRSRVSSAWIQPLLIMAEYDQHLLVWED